MQPTHDLDRGAWLPERLDAGWHSIHHDVPRGYQAYARILHEGLLGRTVGDEERYLPVTWAQAAAIRGRRMHDLVQWSGISGSRDDRTPLAPGLDLIGPQEGRLPTSTLAAVVAALLSTGTSPEDATIGVWNGWAELHPRGGTVGILSTGPDTAEELERHRAAAQHEHDTRPLSAAQLVADHGPWLELPDRAHVLLECDLRELLDRSWVRSAGLGWSAQDERPEQRGAITPNLLWPRDRSWFLASEIDADFTLVGGSTEAVDAVLGVPGLEALPLPPGADLLAPGPQNPRPPEL